MPASSCTARYPRLPTRCSMGRKSPMKKMSTAASAGNSCQSEVTCLCAAIPLLETLKQSTVAVVDVSSGSKTLHGMDDQVKIVELRSHRIDEVSGYAAGS